MSATIKKFIPKFKYHRSRKEEGRDRHGRQRQCAERRGLEQRLRYKDRSPHDVEGRFTGRENRAALLWCSVSSRHFPSCFSSRGTPTEAPGNSGWWNYAYERLRSKSISRRR
ncbi:hypothetical protein AAHE18_09G248400 [Arachis hypogaea]